MKNLSNCSILIVDDTKFNIKILEDTLKSDYQLSVAMDGKAALKFMEEVIPDIILLDIMMPEMDGFEVFSKIKEDDRLKDIPVIFGLLTTNTYQQALDRSGGKHGNKGVEAAITAIKEIASIKN